jgi:hypothetical protein
MRNDIPSMNPGKLAAQAAHVANVAVKRADPQTLKEWEAQTNQGFGTTIVFGADLAFIDNWMAGAIVSDPTYPCEIPLEVGLDIRRYHQLHNNIAFNGPMTKAFYLRDEVVGAWAWGFGGVRPPSLEDLELYP